MSQDHIEHEPLPDAESPETVDPEIIEGDSIEDAFQGSEVNEVVPELLAAVVFRSPPASKLPPSLPPTKDAVLADQYVSQTRPLLEILGFHTCLGGVGRMSTGVRLVGSLLVLVGGMVVVKLQDWERKEKQKGTEGEEQPEQEDTQDTK